MVFRSRRIDPETGELLGRADLETPWQDFRNSVHDAVSKIKVSRRAMRKISGSLHEDTFYSKVQGADNLFAVKKPLHNLTPNEVELIRDPAIRKIVSDRLAELGIETGRGKKADSKTLKTALSNVCMPSGVPIRKVRVLRKDKTIIPIREGSPAQAFVKPGNTHHLCIFQWPHNGSTKRDAVFITMLEAINRVKRKETIIQRIPPKDHLTIPADAEFVMSLSGGEQVLAQVNGQEKLLVFKTSASTQGQLYFVANEDARPASLQRKYVFSSNTLKGCKVTVDTMGRLRWAND